MEQKVLRAPKSESIYHWQNMERIKEGDIIFNYADGSIRVISIAKGKFYDSEIEDGIHAGKPGNKISIDIYDIDEITLASIQDPSNYRSEKKWQDPKEFIHKTLGVIKGPFDLNINIKQGYLFEINYAIAKKLREIYGKEFPEPIERYFTDINETKIDIENKVNVISKLLLSKKQIILYGPPGTGKTYNTKKIAIEFLE